ncbi:hypothetical protein ACOQFL_14560 [Actinopolyspora sp. H202]|uniref:hypothetical protein n=1 Tax=Actinopolyspora sp. H202 TaxID=1500456 RepID=UPI003EE5FADD
MNGRKGGVRRPCRVGAGGIGDRLLEVIGINRNLELRLATQNTGYSRIGPHTPFTAVGRTEMNPGFSACPGPSLTCDVEPDTSYIGASLTGDLGSGESARISMKPSSPAEALVSTLAPTKASAFPL